MEKDLKTDDKSKILFEKFVSTCRNGHKSVEMERILMKARGYYDKAKAAYITSREFQHLVASKTEEITNDPRRIYVYIKDVVDEMKSRRQKPSGTLVEPPNKKPKLSSDNGDGDNTTSGIRNEEKENIREENGEKIDIEEIANHAESKYIKSKIKKLSKALKKIYAVIKKLEQKEVDFDEDNDSSYIQLQRYKERFCKINDKLCELTGDRNVAKMSRIDFSGTDSTEINRCIERFVNSTGQFPDYHDILSLVKKTDVENNMKPDEQRSIAEKAFLRLGRLLQKKRQFESWDCLSVFLKDVQDPAENDEELDKQLNNNAREHEERIQQVIDSFAVKQVEQKLEPEEVPDGADGEDAEEEEEEEEEEDEDKGRDIVDEILKADDDDDDDDESSDENEEQDQDNKNSVLSHEDQNDNENIIEDSRKEIQDESTRNTETFNSEFGHRQGSCTPSDFDDSVHNFSTSEDSMESPSLLDGVGPVSPPVLGEDLSNRGVKHVQGETVITNKEKNPPELIPIDTVSKNNHRISEPCSEGQKSEHDSDIIVCSDDHDLAGSDCHSNIFAESNDSKNVIKNISPLSPKNSPDNKVEPKKESYDIDDPYNCPSTSKRRSLSSATFVSDDMDLPSPSLLEPAIETTVIKNYKRAIVTSLKSDINKFVVTGNETKSKSKYSSVREQKKNRQTSSLSRRYSTSLKASTQSVDVITLE